MVIPTRMGWMALENTINRVKQLKKIGAIRKKGFKMEWNSEWANRSSEMSALYKYTQVPSIAQLSAHIYPYQMCVCEHVFVVLNACSKQSFETSKSILEFTVI